MQLEHRIRLKALLFGIVLVAIEIAIAGTLSWWQSQPEAGDTTLVEAVSAFIRLASFQFARMRFELPGLLAEWL